MTSTPTRGDGFLLLIADADVEHADRLAEELAGHQVRTIVCADGAEALLATGAEQPDAILATARLPTVDGTVLVRTLSARTGIPVVLGIGDGDGQAAAEALAAGATACVAHPYRMRELLPILRAIRPQNAEPPLVLECGALRLDPANLELHLRGRPIRLPLRELRLLELLMRHPHRVVTREQIQAAVWREARGSNTLTVHVQRLRQRLGDDNHRPEIILTVRGVGYRLVPPS